MKLNRVTALFLGLVLAFSLAACGQGASSASTASSSAAAEEAAEEEDAEDAEDAPCPQAARLKASVRLSKSAVTRLNFMVLLLCCFGV